jgi:hypothetical protein
MGHPSPPWPHAEIGERATAASKEWRASCDVGAIGHKCESALHLIPIRCWLFPIVIASSVRQGTRRTELPQSRRCHSIANFETELEICDEKMAAN